MESNEEIAPRSLPAWLSIPVILLCLAGGGWIIHWYVMTDALADESHVLGDVPVIQQPQSMQAPQATAQGGGGWNLFGVRDLTNGRYALRANHAAAFASLAGRHYLYRFRYNNYQAELRGTDFKTLDAAVALVTGKDQAKQQAMKVTDDQLRMLQGLAQAPEVAATPQQREQILATFDAWHSAATVQEKQDLAGKLKAVIDDVAIKSIGTTKALVDDRTKKINQIITPEQWKIDTDMGGGK